MYLNDFKEALLRTKRFGIKTPELEYCNKRFLDKSGAEEASKAIQALGEFSVDEIAFQCLSINIKLYETLMNSLKTRVFYTIGFIAIDEDEYFKQTDASLKQMLKDGVKGPTVNLHAWLTLPSMEILDFSFPTSYGKLIGLPQMFGQVITGHADELTGGLKYYPMIVGAEFLYQAGVIKIEKI